MRVAFTDVVTDVGPVTVPDGTGDDVPFLSDALPTECMGAGNAPIGEDDTVAVRGFGPVEPFAIRSALPMARTGSSRSIVNPRPRRSGRRVSDCRRTRQRDAL